MSLFDRAQRKLTRARQRLPQVALTRHFEVDFVYGGRSYHVRAARDHIGRAIAGTSSFYELDLLEAIRDLGAAGVYLDVGANIGNHSLYFATQCPASAVYSFEPNPQVFPFLLANVQRNRARCVPVNAALGEGPGTVSVSAPPQNLGMGTCSRWVPEDGSGSIQLSADLLALDDVALIKIDVEGMEERVLAGARDLIARCSPLIVAEAHTEAERDQLQAVLDGFAPGYETIGRYCATPTYLWRRTPS